MLLVGWAPPLVRPSTLANICPRLHLPPRQMLSHMGPDALFLHSSVLLLIQETGSGSALPPQFAQMSRVADLDDIDLSVLLFLLSISGLSSLCPSSISFLPRSLLHLLLSWLPISSCSFPLNRCSKVKARQVVFTLELVDPHVPFRHEQK